VTVCISRRKTGLESGKGFNPLATENGRINATVFIYFDYI
jgi:hypothetical protein